MLHSTFQCGHEATRRDLAEIYSKRPGTAVARRDTRRDVHASDCLEAGSQISTDSEASLEVVVGTRGRTLGILVVAMIFVCGCGDLAVTDVQSLFVPTLQRSEIVGFIAGFGTTFAAVPDLITLFRRRSSAGVNPRMAGILAVFQVLWIYYGLLIRSRPVIAWNLLAVVINSLGVAAYLYVARREHTATPATHT